MLAADLNKILSQWTYRRYWSWYAQEMTGGDISVHFTFFADNANRQTAVLEEPKCVFDLDLYSPNVRALHIEAIPGQRYTMISREEAMELVQFPEAAARWLGKQLLEIETHEFHEFFREAKSRKCVIDPHPEVRAQ